MTRQKLRLNILPMTVCAGLLAAPILAFAQADGTPGNPPGTAVGRAIDRATGQPTIPDGAPGNPPGTAVGRAVDRATGTPTSPDGVGNNPPGTALDRAATSAATAAAGFIPARGSAAYERPRLSQIIGANVYNERNERIGEVDDVLLRGDAAGAGVNSPVAVIQVGGFLGMGGRLVVVPLNDLAWNGERGRIVLNGATKEELGRRPAFEYAAPRG
jgi:sporulation protein YlmC with PRC-barrel domain